ncbi:MAG: ATP-binding protein [Planctomycetota bacterium]|jgi:signal transduction histidine kinase/ActR/RegA family two-component response regulator|nr:ATP-binding protein [Planctomycetota bacterium]MDP6940720.1 ATP-binding protein [Planctomycetota bacterium]
MPLSESPSKSNIRRKLIALVFLSVGIPMLVGGGLLWKQQQTEQKERIEIAGQLRKLWIQEVTSGSDFTQPVAQLPKALLDGVAPRQSALVGQLMLFSLSFASIAVLMSAFLLYGTDRLVLDRLRELARVANRVSRGDRKIRALDSGNDEISLLAAQINAMMIHAERNEENLEAEISKRTLELRRANKELGIALASAEDASRAKGEFLANMSHEIRTPLNGVVGMAELLESSGLKGEQKIQSETLRKSAGSLLGIVNDVLDFSKAESGKMCLETAPFSLSETASDVVGLFQMQARQKGLSLEIHLDKNLPQTVLGDSVRLRQVLTNLVGNAVKFTSQGSVQLSLSKLGIERESVRVGFQVKDSGVGIAASAQKGIFQSFTQADASTTRQFGGTGLGLAISQKFVRLMGGEIQLESQPGVGSQFSFECCFENVQEQTPKETAPRPLRILPGLRVLLVEDQPVNRAVAIRMLERFGADVGSVEHGRKAVECAHEGWDLILMDCQMPIMDGYEATRLIRRREKGEGLNRVPVIAMTAHAMAEDKEKCLEAGMDDYLAKPVTLTSLESCLRRWALKSPQEQARL